MDKEKIRQSRLTLETIEEEFFELDHERKTALLRFEYERPEDIFDSGAVRNIPMVSRDFLDKLIGAFDCIPSKYKLDIRIVFDDMQGYSEEQLMEIFQKNILLGVKIAFRVTRRQNRLALALFMTGVFFVLLSIWFNHTFTDDGVFREIVSYILDIAATVPFWGAMEVFFIDNREKKQTAVNIARRFHGITFEQKDREAD